MRIEAKCCIGRCGDVLLKFMGSAYDSKALSALPVPAELTMLPRLEEVSVGRL